MIEDRCIVRFGYGTMVKKASCECSSDRLLYGLIQEMACLVIADVVVVVLSHVLLRQTYDKVSGVF